jgi:hypothetical protein
VIGEKIGDYVDSTVNTALPGLIEVIRDSTYPAADRNETEYVLRGTLILF